MDQWNTQSYSHSDIYVISDLHLGGEPKEGRRGFRLMTQPRSLASFIETLAAKPNPVELVINGDFVDFLAERHDNPPEWRSMLQNDTVALETFLRIASPDASSARYSGGDVCVFTALRRFVAAGHRLTVILGNHDVELSYPRVREAFFDLVGAPIEFLYDNQALVRGDVVIEHGNRYDRFNQVDHDGLRRMRSVLSRHADLPERGWFAPPPGSYMVAEVMNHIKKDFPFVDLLKPEMGAVIPTLLALNPSYRGKLLDVARALLPAATLGVESDGEPTWESNMSAGKTDVFAVNMGCDSKTPPDAWDDRTKPDTGKAITSEEGASATPEEIVFGKRVASLLCSDVPPEVEFAAPCTSLGTKLRGITAIFDLFTADRNTPVEKRLPALLNALRLLEQDQSFSLDVETHEEYEDAALKLLRSGFRYVVFGHTHLPKRIRWEGLGSYLNCGTWADRIRLPEAIFAEDKGIGLQVLADFIGDLRADPPQRLLFTDYRYVHLEMSIEGGQVRCRHASLKSWPKEKP